MSLTAEIKARARALGFDMVGIVPVQAPAHGAAFAGWLEAGHHGQMEYIANRAAARLDPLLVAPDARSMITLALNYNPGPPPPGHDHPGRGRIARYAWAPDYHEAIKPRLFALDGFIRSRSGRSQQGKACVDTAPLLERDFAMQAGLGFVGRNTCLITPRWGSWTFLAALLIPEVLDFDQPPQEANGPAGAPAWTLGSGKGTCGLCRRCLVSCPTNAFVAPYVLDSRRCISYLTIELRGPVPRELRPLMGNWVFGCDVCQEVCPYNRAAPVAALPMPPPDLDRVAPRLPDLLALDEAGFRRRYRGTPILRSKRRGLVRNACIAAGNWGDPEAVPPLVALLEDSEALVRGHAAWALGCYPGRPARSALERALSRESDPWVRQEIELARQAAGG